MKTFPRFINQFLVYMQLNEVKGKYRFYQLTHKLFKHFVIRHEIANSAFYVPYDQWCFWKNYGPNNYYLDEMIPFTEVLNNQLSDFDFVDLGADIGTVSALVKKYCSQLKRIIAVEPNPYSYSILRNNHKTPEQVFNCAVSNFNGACHFEFDGFAGSDHEGFISPSKQGDTQVFTLDNLVEQNKLTLADDIAIKIDVEGQENAVFQGAKKVIKQANKTIVLLELHPDTLNRDKITPEMIFSEAESIKGFEWYVPLCANQKVDRSKPFFEQFANQQYDVIGITT